MDFRALMERVESAKEWARTRQRTIASVAICAAAVFLAYHVFTGSNGIHVYTQKRAENLALQKELEQLKKENEDLTQRVKSLKSDPETIEKEAREQLRYAKPGEVIFTLPEQKPAIPANATAQQKKP